MYQPRTPTKADAAYRLLRRAIVVGEIPANRPLDDAELAARYGAGRTPVREALKRLALEQFLLWPPRGAPYVRDLTLHEVHRLYESRLLIEVPAARLAASRITDAALTEVAQIAEQLPDAAARGQVYESIELDHALHLAVTRGADNRFLGEAVGHLNCGSLRLWYLAHQHRGLAQVPAEHDGILDALRARDPDRAETAVREHILLSHSNQMRIQSLPAESFRLAGTG